MTRFEQVWTADVLTAFTVDDAEGLTPLPGEVDYLRTFQRMRRKSTKLAALGLRVAVWMVALAPLWLLGRIATFSKLKPRDRTELLVRLLAHKSMAIRELAMLLKLTAAMALLGSATARARSGYDTVQSAARIESGVRVRLPVVSPSTADANVAHSTEPKARAMS
jgi:hypothetical protein